MTGSFCLGKHERLLYAMHLMFSGRYERFDFLLMFKVISFGNIGQWDKAVAAVPDLFRHCSARNRTEPIVVFQQRRFYSALV